MERSTATPMRALVVTVVHRPGDARIAHRQLGALRDAGWHVTYAAPWSSTGDEPDHWHDSIDLPRAVGRRRLSAVLAARRVLRREGAAFDVVLLHDPELLLALPLLDLPHVVWDVHEDPATAIEDRDWIPRWTRPLLRPLIRSLERWSERRCAELLLAEDAYQARFRRDHPVVPNVPLVPERVPAPGTDRVIYVGRISRSRGAVELVALGRRLHGEVTVQLVGAVDPDAAEVVAEAHDAGVVQWLGFLPNDEALAVVRGAAFGLSLLHDEPNYRHSMPTKVLEYLANGVPVITTPLPLAVELLERHGLGTVVAFGDVDGVEEAIRTGIAHHEELVERGRLAHAAARHDRTWATEGPRFVDALAAVAQRPR